jgi:hypothetical protein
MARRVAILTAVALLAWGVLGLAAEENASAGRSLGVGIQVGTPIGGLVSVRYWFSPRVGTEGVFFVWGSTSDLNGSATGRVLYRVSDGQTVDFYVAAGATAGFSSYAETTITLSGVGGIEFSFPFAQNLAWNLEFGLQGSTAGDLGMALGTGIHFYF